MQRISPIGLATVAACLLIVLPGRGEDYAAQGDHWAFSPIRSRPAPLISQPWPRSPIDSFLLETALAHGIEPASDADVPTAVRRLYYTLHGLPPAPQDLERFLADTRPDRWERLVDRLLASPRFGERWGRHWLDVARYADSSGGGRSLIFSESWRYRDYVVESFNRDTPFDRFVLEQIAGDLLPAENIEARRRALIATGFLVIGPNNYETQNKRLLDYDIADEQIETVGKAFLGISLGCARCHDHKFDPVATREYYALAGIFLNTRSVVHDNVSRWYEVELPPDEELVARREAALEKLRAIERLVEKTRGELSKFDGTYENTPANPENLRGTIIEAEAAAATGDWVTSQHSARRIGSQYLHDGNTGKGQKSLTFRWLADRDGTYVVRLAYTHGGNRPKNVPVEIRTAGATRVVRVDETVPPPEGVFVRLGSFEVAAGDEVVVTVSNEGTKGHVVVDALQILSEEELVERDRLAAEIEEKAKKVEELRKEVPPLERAMAVEDLPAEKITDSPLLIRGQLDARGPVVRRSVPDFLSHVLDSPNIGEKHSGRLELATWLVDARNPLTWRVYVNRVWHYTFGTGLVRTPDNFGTTGEPPSHPELLDFLALRFQQGGASTKRLVRELVCSHAFLLSGETPSLAKQLDPENRLFMRFAKRRLEAEELRDTMLAVSGALDTSMGGPSLPPELRKKGVEEKQVRVLPQDRRRSIYQPLLRNLAPKYFVVFDGANTSFVCGRRFAGVTSLQALYLMNDEFVLEQARATAQLLLHEQDDQETRLKRLFQRVLCRRPCEAEVQACAAYLRDRLDEGTAPETAWAELVHALFCTVEFRYVY